MRSLLWTLSILAGILFVVLGLGFWGASQVLGGSGPKSGGGSSIGLLKIEGQIMDALPILSQIETLRDEGVAGVLVRVDSPGGAVAASQEIYQALLDLRKDSIPVVISMGNTAASGGFYIALAGEKVFANEGTVTGSIGVIAQFPEAKDLFDKLGVHMTTIKSGANKDVGNPFRKPDTAGLNTMQALVIDAYAQFFEATLKARKIDSADLAKVADGRVLTGRQALRAGLVDTLGGYDQALSWLKTRCKLDADAEIRSAEPPKPLMERLMSEGATSAGKALQNVGSEMIGSKHQGILYVAPMQPQF
jgi:protease-4